MKLVTSQICGDPPPGRSALEGYVHIGDNVSHRLYDEDERKQRKWRPAGGRVRVRGVSKITQGCER